MKKKDLIEKIRKSAMEEMPDVLHKIDISKVVIEDQPEQVKSPFNLKRAVSFTFASLFILISGVFTFNFIGTLDNTTPLESDTEIVGFQTISAASLLDSYELTELSLETTDYGILELSETTTVQVDDEIINHLDLVNNYLNMAETVLLNQNQYLYESFNSDNVNFQYAFMYNGTDLAGNLISYQGYYNITSEQDQQIEAGILIHDGKTFQYTSVVIDDGESISYRYRVKINEENYIEVSNSSNDDVQRFVYRIYRDSEMVNESELTLVSNRNNLRAQINITNQLNQEISLDIVRNMSDISNQSFQVKYMIMSNQTTSQGEFTVQLKFNSETDSFNYQYGINSNEIIMENRIKKGNQQATDDDFKPGRSSNNPYVTTEVQSPESTEDEPPYSNRPTSDNNVVLFSSLL